MSRIKGDGIYFGASSPGNRSGSRRISKRHFPHVVQAAASSSLFVTMDAKSGLAACRTQAHLPRRVGIAPHFRFASSDRHRYPPRMVRKSGLGFYPPRHDAPCPTHSCRDLDREAGGMGGRQEIVDRRNVPFGGRVPSPLSRPCATLALAALTRVNVVGFRRHYLTVDGVVGLYYSRTGCYGERYRLNPVRSCIWQGKCLWGRDNE